RNLVGARDAASGVAAVAARARLVDEGITGMTRFIHDRGVRRAAGLAIVVAIPMAVLFYFQFQSLADIETTSAVVLRQLSSETADSLTRAIEDYMKRPHISVLLRIQQRQTMIGGAGAVAGV